MNARIWTAWVFLALVLFSALLLGRSIATATYPAADYHVYVDASRSLYADGNPYARNEGVFFEFHYRYPPLLAMAMPIVRWVWFPLLLAGTLLTLIIRFRASGLEGMMLAIQIGPSWIANLLNGNAQSLTVGMTALAPSAVTWGAVFVALATWIKLYPICVVVWWLGKRDWRALRWFGVAFLTLGLIQLPWMGQWVHYSLAQTGIPAQASLRALGPVPWVAAIAFLAYLTYSRARDDRGWLYCVLLQIAVLPRLQVANLPLLLMHPTLLAQPYSMMLKELRRPVLVVSLLTTAVVGGFLLEVVLVH